MARSACGARWCIGRLDSRRPEQPWRLAARLVRRRRRGHERQRQAGSWPADGCEGGERRHLDFVGINGVDVLPGADAAPHIAHADTPKLQTAATTARESGLVYLCVIVWLRGESVCGGPPVPGSPVWATESALPASLSCCADAALPGGTLATEQLTRCHTGVDPYTILYHSRSTRPENWQLRYYSRQLNGAHNFLHETETENWESHFVRKSR